MRAVGGQDNAALAMRWTGSAWARVPIPAGNSPEANGTLTGAFSSPEVGWAVGTHIPGNETGPVILHRDGIAWN